MLEDAQANGDEHVVSWLPHGKAFRVHKSQEFAKRIMPRYFKQSQFKSFQRQLHIYEFQRITTRNSPDTGAYFREEFIRGEKNASLTMKRNRISSTRRANEDSKSSDSFSSRPGSPLEKDNKSPFPFKLHGLLEAAATNGYEDIVSWLPNGKSFRVHKPQEFAKHIMTRVFNQSQYKSFQRQLNIYGFQRNVDKGSSDMGAYFHKDFSRIHPMKSLKMTRIIQSKSEEKVQKPAKKSCLSVKNDNYFSPNQVAHCLDPLPINNHARRRASMELLRRFSLGVGNDNFILDGTLNADDAFEFPDLTFDGALLSPPKEIVERRNSIGIFRRLPIGIGNGNNLLKLMEGDCFASSSLSFYAESFDPLYKKASFQTAMERSIETQNRVQTMGLNNHGIHMSRSMRSREELRFVTFEWWNVRTR